ncbi:MAG: SMP-30/gluconolactonase/LRE family protein [Rhodospirillum sp.]|nr:SMP-30/gluconolactonase/LRE family protein [Rhodospirillum sp.]
MVGWLMLSAVGATAGPVDAAELIRGKIVAPEAQLETVYDQGVWLEGPVQGPDGRIYLSDVTISFYSGGQFGEILVLDPKSGTVETFRGPSGMTNGLAFAPDGALIAAAGADFGCRCILRTDPGSGKTTILAGTYDGRPFNSPNDLVVTSDGTVYFTDPRYFGHEPLTQPVFGVYRIGTDGAVDLVIKDAARPNGLALSPDQHTLFVAENDIGTSDIRISPPYRQGGMDILAYLLKSDGIPGDRRVFVAMEGARGADGLETDAEGNLYATIQQPDNQGIQVFSPEGKLLALIPTPTMPTNTALAEVDGRTFLYVTGGKFLYRIKVVTHRK